MLLAADRVTDGDLSIDSFWSALGVALVAAAVGVVLDVVFGTNDDDTYTFRVIQRIARRSGGSDEDRRAGDHLPRDRRPRPPGAAAGDAGRERAEHGALARRTASHELAEWETDLSSQTGASQAGILLGSNEDIPAFRWVEKESAKLIACSGPADCAEIERRHATGRGLLADGGASRGNLLSGEADHVILTVSRMDAEKQANPGYRAFFANGFNVMRTLVLFFWEVILEWSRVVQGEASRRPAARSPGRHLPVPARGDVRRRPRPDRLRRPHGHDERPARRLRHLLELRRGRAPLGPRARGHARGAAQARPAVRPDRAGAGATRRGRTRSSCSPTTGRRRARRSSSGTATGSTTSSSGRSPAAARWPRSPAATSRARWSATRSPRRPAHEEEAAEERRLRPRGRRARLREPRARLPDGRAAAADARGDRRAPSQAPHGAARAPARRLAAGPLGAATARSRSARGAPATCPTGVSTARIRSPRSRRTPGAIFSAPTASRTSPTSWSGASTTRCSTTAARSRS